MIDYNDLINRIESMQDLPVSEEMIGAYCEGSLNPIDAAVMDSLVTNDVELGELVDGVDNLQISDETSSLDTYNTAMDDIEIPDIPEDYTPLPFEIDILPNIDDIGMVAAAAANPVFCGITHDFVSGNNDFFLNDDDSFLNDGHSFDVDDDINSDDSFDDFNPDGLSKQ